MSHPAYEEKTIKISEIDLDVNNPRFPPVSNQRDAIQSMLRDQGDKIVSLAADIYEKGLNPSSKLILFKSGSRYIDGDGNRRVTALKILETPSLADFMPKIKNKIDAILKKYGSIPSEAGCVVFEDRDSIRHWVAINHGGEQGGRGQISWNSEQKSRFESKPSIGVEALDFLMHEKAITKDDKERIQKTTLDRLLSFKDVKSMLSINNNGEHFIFNNLENLRKVVLELRDKKVDSVYDAKKGKDFVEQAILTPLSKSEQSGPSVIAPQANGLAAGDSQGTRTQRIKKHGLPVFGGTLSLKRGHVNNLYRDIESVYKFYLSEKKNLSDDFIVLFRMSLRLLAETAAKEVKMNLNDYLTNNYDQAKKNLDQDSKTSLSNQSVEKNKIVQLFQTGAHDYVNSRNEEQALAMSVILGAILGISHGKRQ
ncbi:MAG: hypothetical protein AB7E49_04195 [Campylobacterales bacterium]